MAGGQVGMATPDSGNKCGMAIMVLATTTHLAPDANINHQRDRGFVDAARIHHIDVLAILNKYKLANVTTRICVLNK